MTDHLRDKWNARYRDAQGPGEAAQVLREHQHLLPKHGRALDLACGLGANALLLARQGLETRAWDVSEVAIEALRQRAAEEMLPLHTEVRDVQREPPSPESFDVIVVSRFLDRALVPAIAAALRPGGLLFYQTFTRTAVTDRGPSNPDFRLGENELLQLFASLQVVVYREEGTLGDTGRGFRDEALLIARK